MTSRAILLTILLPISFARTAMGSINDELKIEASDFMRRTAYARPDKIAADISPSGAEGPVNRAWEQTHSGKWYMEEQRYGAEAVSAGISQDDPEAIDRGLKILRWGFDQQQPDGGSIARTRFTARLFSSRRAPGHACFWAQALIGIVTPLRSIG